MNRKEIITADLCGRLIHWVKILRPDGKTILELRGILGNLMQFQEDGNAHETFGSIKAGTNKPILFSSLTEPITISGETFVPLDVIARMGIKKRGLGHFTEAILESQSNLIENYENLDFWIIDLLNQWHINYRLLPGEYIEATNEYA